ncbi:matrin 3-like 1.1 isoform X2 [Xiphias gladius]|uniref:matrin 3-like 1.1 isoform X2 n=1 Tax=Xiphias gladius TaxID=8245 RepID=UPI001A99B2DC|nr:matrin 3-like 1.1 isoform X2 [Xiphias gladius]
MSHKYPYRQPASNSDLGPDPGHYRSSDLRHISPDHGFYRPPQESYSSSYPSSSSSRGSAQWSQDGALSILSSCGLEPSDLSLLAELPEDVLTVESLPRVLKQIKGKRGTVEPFPPNAPFQCSSSSSSYAPISARRPPVSSCSGDWDRLHSQPVQYPPNRVTRSPLPSEQVQNHWGNPRTSSSVREDPPPPSSSSSSSSSIYMVNFHHRPGPSEYGKTSRAPGPVCSRDQPSFGSAGRGKQTRSSLFSEARSAGFRSVLPPDEYPPKPWGGRLMSENSSLGSRRHTAAAALMPSTKEALDFHGTSPQVFPYSCSLCEITVLSERVWIKHVNGTQHADGQLSLLQKFPKWDCRMETVRRVDSQSEKWKDEEKPARPQTANQSQKPEPNKQPQKKTSEKGKVVCVKFPAQSVDETYLRKLTEPFGKIVKILMFPSLAFVELGSVDQAKDLVKFHVNYPPTVNGEQMEFRISNTFNFLQSSRVVSFTPAPTGEDGQSDLISIVKRFGPPLYTLFLPSIAFVEMKNAPDAQKLVDYYSSNTLRINSDFIKVSFSGEYKSLTRVASAKRYEEETSSTKRTRSPSREKEEKTTETKRGRSGSKDGAEERMEEGGKSSRESTSTDESGEKPSRERRESRSRSRSTDKSGSGSSGQNGCREKMVEPEKTEKPDTESKPGTAETEQSEEEAESSAEESDIEGMEVIGEDGENLEDEDKETLDAADVEEEEAAEENDRPAERTNSPGEEKEEEVKDGETDDQEKPVKEQQQEDSETPRETEETAKTAEAQLEDDQEDPDFPADLENCITLDELEEDQSDDQESRVEPESPSTRVVYFRNLPLHFYTDAEFVKLVKDFGKAVRYLLIRRRREGFIEMASSSEALRAAKELTCKSVAFHGSEFSVHISDKYKRLANRWEVQSDWDEGKGSECQSHSSRTRPDRHETCRKSEGRKESGSKKSPNKESTDKSSENESVPRKTPEKEPSDKKTQQDVRNISGKDSASERSTDEESVSKKTEERDSAAKKTPGKELLPKTSPENEKLKRKGTNESNLVPGKTPKKELEREKVPTEKEPVVKDFSEKDGSAEQTPQTEEAARKEKSEETSEPAVQASEKSPDPADSTGDPPKPQTQQKPAAAEYVVKLEQTPGPAGGAAEPEEPPRPVGTEFVRPVVGYFCNLCQVIYADEDEAKLRHCSSLTHYRKYQEKMRSVDELN